jgi:hypothetical protein
MEDIDLDDYEFLFDETEDIDGYEDVPFNSSPVYPRIFIGDSPRYISDKTTHYADPNVAQTWTGLISYYG